MTEAEFRALKAGDTIKHYAMAKPYTVTAGLHYHDELGAVVSLETGGWARMSSADAWKIYTVPGIPGEQEAAHYRVEGVPEAWEVIEALQSSWPEDVRYHVGNVLKYVFRLGRKQGASVESDLEKIRNYADRAIKVLGKAGGK